MMMTTPERFVAEREAAWEELEAALRRAGDRPEKLGADGVRRLGELYRATAADLAFARRTFGDSTAGRAARRAGAARACGGLLRARGGAGRCGRSCRAGIGSGWPSGPALLAAAWLLLLVPAGLGALWGLVDAPAAAGLVPADFQSAADPPVEGRDYNAVEASAFSFQVMFNNIQVTLLAFAGGITFGLLTVVALFFNGLLLGTIAGLAIGAGNGIAFLRLVSSHGPLEISCIVVGGVAGLRMGWALIRPGTLRRATSLRQAAIPAVELAAGTAPWLVLCGFLEGFATGPELPVAVQTALGFSLFALFWSLVLVRGRQRTARALARR